MTARGRRTPHGQARSNRHRTASAQTVWPHQYSVSAVGEMRISWGVQVHAWRAECPWTHMGTTRIDHLTSARKETRAETTCIIPSRPCCTLKQSPTLHLQSDCKPPQEWWFSNISLVSTGGGDGDKNTHNFGEGILVRSFDLTREIRRFRRVAKATC